MLRAVVVEDNSIQREYLRQLLDEIDDIQVVGEAKDGPEALEMIAKLCPEVIFLDIGLPGLDGLEVARQLALAGIKPFIVFVTGDRQHAPEAFDLGSVDYLLKPYTPLRLQKTISRVREQVAILKVDVPKLIFQQKKEEMLFIPLHEIILAETDKENKINIHTKAKIYTVRG